MANLNLKFTEDYNRAKIDNFAKRIHLVSGIGIETKRFKPNQDESFFLKHELSLPEESIILTSIGELNENKNHKVVIKALSQLKNSNVHYVICGQGEKEMELNKLAEKLEVNIHLLGFRKDISRILNGSDIFIFPSLREGLPVSIMEAMASGLPIIASNIRGNSDLVDHGKGGYLFELNSVDYMLKFMNKLILNTSLRNEYGEYNMRKIKEFSLSNVNQQMRAIYSGKN